MWPLFQPIRTLEILKLCEISWDLLKKYFHLKSNAVYNSSAKNYLELESCAKIVPRSESNRKEPVAWQRHKYITKKGKI